MAPQLWQDRLWGRLHTATVIVSALQAEQHIVTTGGLDLIYINAQDE